MTMGTMLVAIVVLLAGVWASAYVIRSYPDNMAKIEKERAAIRNQR